MQAPPDLAANAAATAPGAGRAEVAGLITTIITSYNKAPYLAEAIDSALAQDYPHQEILVVDDGSGDETRAVAGRYGDRIRYIYQENRGQSAARNRGILEARGEFIAFLDGDDRWRPGKLARQMDLFRRDPGLGLVYTDRLVFRGDEVVCPASRGKVRFYRGSVLDDIMIDMIMPFSSIVARRSCLIDSGLFDEGLRVAEDFDLWLRLARKYRADYVGEVLMEYRVGIESVASGAKDRLGATARIQDNFIERHYGGLYPNRRAVALGMANRYAVAGWEHLKAGRRLRAARAYATALRFDPLGGRRYLSLLRAMLPAAAVEPLRGLLGRGRAGGPARGRGVDGPVGEG